MAKSILAFGTLALIFTLLLLINYIISNTSIGETLFVSSGVQTYDAVIVGAGWAGIKAAETLLRGGADNILVLEAHDYIGGR
jgi:NADPH-dependent 2,4-dienoyl-CoA reductase/sulfur reductase-like enzyme